VAKRFDRSNRHRVQFTLFHGQVSEQLSNILWCNLDESSYTRGMEATFRDVWQRGILSRNTARDIDRSMNVMVFGVSEDASVRRGRADRALEFTAGQSVDV